MAVHQPLDHAERIVLVVDRERRRSSDEMGRRAEHSRADRVEGTDPHPGRILAEQASDTLPHLAGGLVRERDGENVPRISALDVDQPSDARRQHARLSRSGACEYEQRSVHVQHGFALRGVESGGEFVVQQRRQD